MDQLHSFGLVRAVDADTRRATVIASTNAIARDGAIIDQDGWDLSYYERNPVVLWAHQDHELPIGRTVSSQVVDGALIQTHEFFDDPRSEAVWTRVRDGYLGAVSVRWIPGETEVRKVAMPDGSTRKVFAYTRGHQLLETSYVSVPADPGAVVLRSSGQVLDHRALLPADAPDPEPDNRLAALLRGLSGQTLGGT